MREVAVALDVLPPEGVVPTRLDWNRLSAHLRTELRTRIEALERVFAELDAVSD